MKNMLLLLFSLSLAFLLAETLTRSLSQSLPPDIMIHYQSVKSDKGYELNPNDGIIQSQPPARIEYRFYPYHFRDTNKKPHTTSILVLGDSFTFGWLLPPQETYVYQLQSAFDKVYGINQYQFLNAATPGWGTVEQLAYLEDFGEKIAPKFVLIFLNTDDIGRSLRRYSYQLTNPTTRALTPNFHAVKKTWREMIYSSWLYSHSVFLHLLHDVMYDGIWSLIDRKAKYTDNIIIPMSDIVFDDEFAIRYAEALFTRMNEWCKKHHAKLLIITTGYNAFYANKLHDPTKIFLSHAESFFKKEGIPYYDMAHDFKNVIGHQTILIPREGHPNAFGAATIAKLSWPWIKQQMENSA